MTRIADEATGSPILESTSQESRWTLPWALLYSNTTAKPTSNSPGNFLQSLILLFLRLLLLLLLLLPLALLLLLLIQCWIQESKK